MCTSKAIPKSHGDRAVAINVHAFQEDSCLGISYKKNSKQEVFSDAHDAVLVPLYWNSAVQPLALPVHTAQQLQPRADSNMRPAPTAPPAPSTPCTSSSQMLQASPAAPATSSSHLDNSAVQPVALPVHPEQHLQPPAASNVRPAPKTPTPPSAPCTFSSQML